MTCSVQNAGRKSTSGWHDRLRLSKGIPTGDDVDLEHFITHHIQRDAVHDPVPPNPAPVKAPPATAIHRKEIPGTSRGKDSMFNIMSNMLAELFVMGGATATTTTDDGFPKSKCSQKQRNPSFCGSVNSPALSCTNNSSNSSNDFPDRKRESAAPAKLVENVNEEEKGWNNLSGFSRTEVTVIDTSFAKWKFEKMLFRKKNVWRVRDKKGKGGHFAKKKKKRKPNELLAAAADDVGAKKSKEYRESYKSHSTSTLASANFGKAVKKKHLALNSDKGSSSAVPIKSIHADKKGSTSIPRSWSEKSTEL